MDKYEKLGRKLYNAIDFVKILLIVLSVSIYTLFCVWGAVKMGLGTFNLWISLGMFIPIVLGITIGVYRS